MPVMSGIQQGLLGGATKAKAELSRRVQVLPTTATIIQVVYVLGSSTELNEVPLDPPASDVARDPVRTRSLMVDSKLRTSSVVHEI